MKDRCLNPNKKRFCDYGGRGIKVCIGWRNSFRNFLNDMGFRPTLKYTLDRKNVNGNYSCGHCEECVANGWPANCKWSTAIEQANNKRGQLNKTGYKGVYKESRRWKAGVNISLGTYDTPEEAALAYNVAMIKLRGDEAILNEIK